MKKFRGWITHISESIRVGIYRFPVTIAFAATIMVIGLILLHNETTMPESVRQWLERIAFTLGLGIPLSVALRLFIERRDHRSLPLTIALWAGLILVLGLYLIYLLPVTPFQSNEETIRYLMLLLTAVVLVVVVPYFPKGTGDERFALKLLWRVAITWVFTGILIAGISLMLLMLDKLLGVYIDEKTYADNAILCIGLFAPSFFLAGVPSDREAVNAELFQPMIKILLGYIVFPLLSIYTVIIYAFFIRILVLWDWPSNMMVNMVLWYTAIGVLALYFMRSQSEKNHWFRFFDRWYPRLTVLPIILMFVGLFVRISAYGFTEPRYLVLVLGIWVTCMTLLAIIKKPKHRSNIVAPTLLAVLALIAVLGPLSAFDVSRSSQNTRLDALLARNNMLTDQGTIQPNENVPEADQREIYAVLDYFSSNHTLADARAVAISEQGKSFPDMLGFKRPQTVTDKTGYHDISIGNMANTIDVQGYDYFFTNGYGKVNDQTNNGIAITLNNDNVFTVTMEGQELYRNALNNYIIQLDESYAMGRSYTQDELTFTDENDTVRVKFMFRYVGVDYMQSTPNYNIGGLDVLVDVK